MTPPAASPNPDSGPIFIVGAPRSGTSLLRVMLNRHPAIGLCDETYYFYYVYSRQRVFGDLSDKSARTALVKQYLETDRVKRLGLDLDQLREELVNQGNNYEALFLALIRFYAFSQGKKRYGEKTPQNALFARTLCDKFPDSKLIHLVRDPRDVVASLLRMPWASNSVLANARIWLECNLKASMCQNFSNYYLVRYENLVEDPEIELRRLCGFIGEEYSPAMLQVEKEGEVDKWWFKRAQGTLTKNRVGDWEKSLNVDQTALVEWVVKTHMGEYGYIPKGQDISYRVLALALGREIRDAIRQRLIRMPRLWYYYFQPKQLAKEEVWNDRNIK